jgi:hypothetical protein
LPAIIGTSRRNIARASTAEQHAPKATRTAIHPAASDLFGQLKADMAGVAEAMAAARELLAAG